MRKKKTYLAPEVKVVEIEQTDIICQSTPQFGIQGQNFEDEEDW